MLLAPHSHLQPTQHTNYCYWTTLTLTPLTTLCSLSLSLSHQPPSRTALHLATTWNSRSCDYLLVLIGKCGASVATFSGFAPGNPLSELGDVNFHVKSFDYGIVETAHLAMLHATLREFRA